MVLTDRQADNAIIALAACAELEEDPFLWLAGLFPDYCTAPLADHHVALWEWVWDLEPGTRPRSFVGVWPRGGAKSTNAEMACVALGARRKRRYGLYISGTQDQANDHVQNVGAMFESKLVNALYPEIGERLVTKYGHSKGWKINRLRTGAGFSLDAVGLDTAARGLKLDEARPDFIVLDDIDSEADTPETTAKKIRTLTRKLLPTGSTDVAVLAIQNLVIKDGIFARLSNVSDKPADFLFDRIVSGPVPAVKGLVHVEREGRHVIVSGEASWAGQDLATCQNNIDDWGISAFLAEAQHDVEAPPGGMYDHVVFQRCKREDMPELVRVATWVDPAVSDTDSSDSMGIQCDGLGTDDVLYRLRSYEQRSSPLEALKTAIRWALEEGGDTVGVETDQGGDTWESVYREACAAVALERESQGLPKKRPPRFVHDKAGRGYGSKAERGQHMLTDYELPGRIVHVEGYHGVLEAALKRFPRTKPLDLADAAYWSWKDLAPMGVGDRTLNREIWRWFEHIPPPERADLLLTSWFAAYDESTRPLAVGQVWLKSMDRYYLLAQERSELSLPELAQAMRDLELSWPEARTKLFPSEGNGPHVVSSLAQQVKGLVPWKSPEDADGVQLVATLAKDHKIALKREPWAQDLVSEASRFPGGVEGSMARCLIQAVGYLAAGTGQGQYRDARLAGRR